jgi:adenylate cyclase
MTLMDFFETIDKEVKNTVSSDFDIEITDTKLVPNFNDSYLTFDNSDNKKKKCKRLESCVLYVDIRNSVQISASKQPKTLAKTYSAFIRSMILCGRYYGGHVRNIIGDRVMIVFDQDDCFKNSVNTAILMSSVCKYILNKNITTSTIECGIGIDYGKMLITKSGAIKQGAEKEFYRSLVWLGRPANVASRLTDLAYKKETYTTPSISQGNYYKHIDEWSWQDKTYDQFLDDLEVTYSKNLRHKDENFSSFHKSIKGPFSSKNNPILMTKAVYDGFKSSCPNDNSIINSWLTKKDINVKDYTGDVYGGDVIFTQVKEIENA